MTTKRKKPRLRPKEKPGNEFPKKIGPWRVMRLSDAPPEVVARVKAQWAREEQRRGTLGSYRQPVTMNLEERRFVSIGGEVIHLDPKVTLFDFFMRLAMAAFPRDWYTEENAIELKQHPFARWLFDVYKFQEGIQFDEKGQSNIPPNYAMMAIARLGYDLFIVRDNTAFLESTITRLRVTGEFHSARYELSVGALLSIADFEVSYVDAAGATTKTYEMRAKNRSTSVEIAVEAKRRHWEHANKPPLNEQGTWNLGIRRLLKKAFQQLDGSGLPGVVFVDLNFPRQLPGETDQAFNSAALTEVAKVAKNYADGAVPVNLVVLTNHPYNNPAAYEAGKESQARFVGVHVPAIQFDLDKYGRELFEAAAKYQRLPRTWAEFVGAEILTPPPDPPNDADS